jgi:hypothetical protein
VDDQEVLICTQQSTCLYSIVSQQTLKDFDKNVDQVKQSQDIYLFYQALVVIEGLQAHH